LEIDMAYFEKLGLKNNREFFEAREHMSQERSDAVLLGIMLPDGNGLDLLTEIRVTGSGYTFAVERGGGYCFGKERRVKRQTKKQRRKNNNGRVPAVGDALIVSRGFCPQSWDCFVCEKGQSRWVRAPAIRQLQPTFVKVNITVDRCPP
jgi:hypothetical protein